MNLSRIATSSYLKISSRHEVYFTTGPDDADDAEDWDTAVDYRIPYSPGMLKLMPASLRVRSYESPLHCFGRDSDGNYMTIHEGYRRHVSIYYTLLEDLHLVVDCRLHRDLQPGAIYDNRVCVMLEAVLSDPRDTSQDFSCEPVYLHDLRVVPSNLLWGYIP